METGESMADGSGETAASLRQEAVAVLRQRATPLVSDLTSELRTLYAGSLDDEAARAAAALLVTLIVSAIEHGELSPRAGAVHDLHRLCVGALGPRQLFQAVDRASRLMGDELALDDRLGATSEPWPLVLQLVRGAALDVLAAFTARLLDTPAHGAVRDPLTTLIARPVFDLSLQQETLRAFRHKRSFALILFDVDDLSSINREHGYGVGDRLLERLGILARRFFRTHDWLARHGEDSIAALLPDTSLDQAALLATRFRDAVHERLVLVDHKTDARNLVTLTAAVVGAEHVPVELDAAAVMAEAEAALARAKLNGGDRTERVTLLPTSVTLLSAASLLECTPGDVRRLVRSGRLRAAKHGRHFHVDRSELERYQTELTIHRRGERDARGLSES